MKLFDLHCDTLTACEKQALSLHHNNLHWDYTRACRLFEESFQILAIYTEDGTNEKDAWDTLLRILTFLKSENIPMVRTAHDLQTIRHGGLLAVENGNVIGSDIDKIEQLAAFGVVYMTITWNDSNLIGNGCFASSKEGLSSYGRRVIPALYRAGILPDVSHLNEAGFWDVCELSENRPFIASHSDSYTVCPHPRNLTDDQFCEIVRRGGLVGINLCGDHLGGHSFEQIERHLVRYWELGGAGTLALGMDLDGMDLPEEWGGIDIAKRLYAYLLDRQYPQNLIDQLFYENSRNFFTKSLTS